MKSLGERLRQSKWGLPETRTVATEIAGSEQQIRALLRELFSDDVEVRKRAADVARRITEIDASLLHAHFDELSGLLETLLPGENRTRWHLGLVVPRIAHTRAQRLRAARIMLILAEDQSNVVRCSAVEGLGALALKEESLREDAEPLIYRYLHTGTLAMKARARHVEKLLAKASPR
jgi:HEAT repeat protein